MVVYICTNYHKHEFLVYNPYYYTSTWGILLFEMLSYHKTYTNTKLWLYIIIFFIINKWVNKIAIFSQKKSVLKCFYTYHHLIPFLRVAAYKSTVKMEKFRKKIQNGGSNFFTKLLNRECFYKTFRSTIVLERFFRSLSTKLK